VAGPGAADLLEWLCDNRVARDPGQVTYTQMLNSRGGIECDFTVARLGEELFSIVTGTAFGNHDREWIRRHLPDDGSVQVRDVTSAWACFGIWGPRSRGVLEPLTTQSLSNEDFPYMTAREITVGDVPVRALRVTYVGELGWELYCPSEYGMALWQALWEAGEPHGIVAGGYRAIDSLRVEKGYRVWGADITPDETPYEAGLDFAVKMDKDFLGRDALAEATPRKRLCCITLEDPRSVALGNEPVRVSGEIAGRVTTGSYGYTVERSIAYAYLPPELSEPGTGVELDIFGSWVAGEVTSEPLFDPGGERVRGSA
jgi:4-methylaminobutanoate oxidase (formaldehyde-forming)